MRLERSVGSAGPLVSTLVLSGAAPAARESAPRDVGCAFALRLPPGWSRTAEFAAILDPR